MTENNDDSWVEDLFSEGTGEGPGEDQRRLSRRQFLRGGMAGGAAGLAVAAGTGVAVWQISAAEARAAREEAEAEVVRLKGLVSRYEALEKIGLDGILQTGMAAVALPLQGVELGAKALRSGLELIEGALLSLEEALPTAEEAILWLEQRISGLAEAIAKLEGAIGDVLEKAVESPIGEAVQEAADAVLQFLPFGLGDKVRVLFEGVGRTLAGIDDLTRGFNGVVLEPLRDRWFSTEDGKGVRATLVAPLVEKILDPLEEHLGGLAALSDSWQQHLSAPARLALEERATAREEIAAYKREHGLE